MTNPAASIDIIEHELATIEHEHRSELIQSERRDFEKEAREADEDTMHGPLIAKEIMAEATLFRGRCRRREERINELKRVLAEAKAADMTEELEALAQQHAQAVEDAREALESVPDLAELEQAVDRFADAQRRVRQVAVKAGTLAKAGGHPLPELLSVYSRRLVGWYGRLTGIQTNTQGEQGVQQSIDRSRYGVPRVALD
ncbi:hypothetical protein [Chromohalobacter japonicus]|uniref:hypothetical protein n=1 Tax=Chromohalobacter japonicus TaxID=223900 RepID=UPI001FF51E3E|nr:hypothetical protein [Chromohalobacter japonicus]MCK0751747.1 hypothetical protein [Chromohalobacter japonicus]